MNKSYLWILILGIVSVIAVSFISIWNLNLLLSSYEERRILYVQRDNFTNLLSALKDAETGQRGYMLTGRSDYLEPYYEALRNIESYQTLVEKAVAASQQPLYLELKRLIDLKLQIMKANIDAVQEGQPEKAERIESLNTGKQAMDNIRSVSAQLIDTKEAVISQKQNEIAQASTRTLWTTILSIIFANLLIGLYSYLFYRDMKKIKKISEELNYTSSIYEVILTSTKQAMIMTDTKGIVISFNKSAEKMLGYKAQEVIDQVSILDFYDQESLRDKLESSDSSRTPHSSTVNFELLISPSHYLTRSDSEWMMKRKNGSVFPCLQSITPLNSEQNQIAGFLFIASDMTEDKKREKEIQAAYKATEDVYLSKNKFLSSLGYDFRPPLAKIVSLVELLQKNKSNHLDRQELSYLAHILESGNELLELTNRVVDLSKVEGGFVALNQNQVLLPDLIRKIIDEAETQQTDGVKPFQLKAEVPASLQPLETDPEKLRAILANLIRAAKSCHKSGLITLRVKANPQTLQAAEIDVISVPDGVEIRRSPAEHSSLERLKEMSGVKLNFSLAQSIARVLGYHVRQVEQDKRRVFTLILSAASSDKNG